MATIVLFVRYIIEWYCMSSVIISKSKSFNSSPYPCPGRPAPIHLLPVAVSMGRPRSPCRIPSPAHHVPGPPPSRSVPGSPAGEHQSPYVQGHTGLHHALRRPGLAHIGAANKIKINSAMPKYSRIFPGKHLRAWRLPVQHLSGRFGASAFLCRDTHLFSCHPLSLKYSRYAKPLPLPVHPEKP